MPTTKHMGFKGTAKFVGWMIGIIVLIFEFLANWIPAVTVTTPMIVKVLTIAAVAAIGIPAMFYLGDILWSFADKIKENLYAE